MIAVFGFAMALSPLGFEHIQNRGIQKRGGHHVQNVLNTLPTASSSSTTYFYHDALLDHFGGVAGASTKWMQRFYIDQTHWCGEGCPIFLYIGGEGPQGPVTDHLFIWTLAEQYGALLVALEHRFYGESFPTADMSVANLQYLSSQQALADLARFIAYISSFSPTVVDTHSSPPLTLNASPAASKWVSFGGSYPGALSAWLKLKYPASIAGAVSSSGPYFADYNFEQYAEVVGTALNNPAIGGSPECFSAVEEAVSALHELVVGTQPRGLDPAIPTALRPCNTSGIGASDLDLATFEAWIFDGFQGTVQYNNEVPAIANVKVLCEAMTNKSIAATPLDRLSNVQKNIYSTDCQPSSFEDENVVPLTNVTFDGYGCDMQCSSGRQWIWQSCNEFGYFQTTTSTSGNPFAAFKANAIYPAGGAICKSVFGLDVPPETNETNTFYGARQLLAGNVTIVNGGMDPWHSLSIVDAADPFYESCVSPNGEHVSPGCSFCRKQQVLPSSHVITIPTTAHCGDMYSPNRFASPPFCPGPSCHDDLPSVVEAHGNISADVAFYIGSRIGQWKPDGSPLPMTEKGTM